MEDLYTERLRLVAVSDASLAREAAGLLPELPGVSIEGCRRNTGSRMCSRTFRCST